MTVVTAQLTVSVLYHVCVCLLRVHVFVVCVCVCLCVCVFACVCNNIDIVIVYSIIDIFCHYIDSGSSQNVLEFICMT